MNNCSGQGDCILVNVCACYPSFDGELCDQNAKENLHAPKFEQTLYNAIIKENSPAGTLIFQLHANDSDSGRNGQLFYTAMRERNVDSLITVDGTSGKVYNSFAYDFDNMDIPSFNVTFFASDNGFPQKSAFTSVQITVVDENDNCPFFVLPSGNLEVTISDPKPGDLVTTVSATDLDSGLNGDITYSITNTNAFSIDLKTGVIRVANKLMETKYLLTIGANDNGEISCQTRTSLTVNVVSLPKSLPSKKPSVSSSKEPAVSSSFQTDTPSSPPRSSPTSIKTSPPKTLAKTTGLKEPKGLELLL